MQSVHTQKAKNMGLVQAPKMSPGIFILIKEGLDLAVFVFFHPCNKWFLTNITNKYVRGRHRSLGLWECIEPLCLQNRDWTHVCVYGYQIAILANFRIYLRVFIENLCTFTGPKYNLLSGSV